MSSISRVLRDEEGGSGGKILPRRRHGAPASSPYQRPLPSSTQNQSTNWFLRASRMVANGAGKLVSSIFGSNNSNSEMDSSSEEGDVDISPEVDEPTQIGITPVTHRNVSSVSELVTQKSEVKLVIEQLVQQVTFSRDECINLTKILQSRVVDCPVPKEGEDAALRGITRPEEGLSPQLGRKSLDISPSWGSSLKSVALGCSANQTPRHDICNATVMEAKKWLEEKRLVSCSSSGRDQLCTLNASALLPVTEDADRSPVNMAKSYMQVRSAWASPSLSHTGFRTPPPPMGTHFGRDGGPYTLSGNTSSSSKVLKRNSPAVGTWNSVGEIRRVRLKSTEDISETPMFKQIDSSSRVSEHGVCQVPLVSIEKQVEADKSIDESVNLSAELAVNDGSPDVIFILPNEKSIEGNLLSSGGLDTEIQNEASNRVISEPEQTMHSQNVRPGAATSTSPDNNQDFEVARLTNKHGVGSGPGSNNSIIPDSMSLQHNGDLSGEALNAEPKVMMPSETKHGFTSDAVDVAMTNNALTSSLQTSSQVEKTFPAKNSAQPQQLSVLKEADTGIDSRMQNGDNPLEQDGNVLANGVTANGLASSPSSSAAGVDPNLGSTSERSQNFFDLSNGTMAVGNTVDSRGLSSKAFIEFPVVYGADSVEDGSKKDSSIKDELMQSQQSNSSHGVAERRSQRVAKQGEKVLMGQRERGRGRVRGRGRGK